MFLSADDMVVTSKFTIYLQKYTFLNQLSLLINVPLFDINTQESAHLYMVKSSMWKLKLKAQYNLS